MLLCVFTADWAKDKVVLTYIVGQEHVVDGLFSLAGDADIIGCIGRAAHRMVSCGDAEALPFGGTNGLGWSLASSKPDAAERFLVHLRHFLAYEFPAVWGNGGEDQEVDCGDWD